MLIESALPPHDVTPLHRHLRADESLYLLEGQLTVVCGEEEFIASRGSLTFLPRQMPHRFTAGADGARMLILGTSAGIEGFFEDWESSGDAITAGRRHGIEFVAPNDLSSN